MFVYKCHRKLHIDITFNTLYENTEVLFAEHSDRLKHVLVILAKEDKDMSKNIVCTK